ncbi:hypothetical protein GCM10023156_54110 [Novipirellula rosea]|uniref:Transposase DDE domain-containing protein n=1 Tax=Novipirellula rosea TaxID=1031540 RepID=A0ABP8NHL9_9BACT
MMQNPSNPEAEYLRPSAAQEVVRIDIEWDQTDRILRRDAPMKVCENVDRIGVEDNAGFQLLKQGFSSLSAFLGCRARAILDSTHLIELSN